MNNEIKVGTKVIVNTDGGCHCGEDCAEMYFFKGQPGIVVSGPDKDGDYEVLQNPEPIDSEGEGWYVGPEDLTVVE